MTYPQSRLLGRGPHGIIRSLCQNSSLCFVVLFSSTAAKLSSAFPQAIHHKPPGFFPEAELKLELSSCLSVCVSPCKCVSLFALWLCFYFPLSLSFSLSSDCSTHIMLRQSSCFSFVLVSENVCGRENSRINSSHCLKLLLLLCLSLQLMNQPVQICFVRGIHQDFIISVHN